MKEYDIPLMDIELARVRPDLDISEYEPAFEKAAELGASDVLGSVWTRDRAYYTDQVGKIAEMAKKYGLNYNVEFLPWAGVRNLQEAITLVDNVAADNLYIMVDTLHAGRAGVTGAELSRTNKKYFRKVDLRELEQENFIAFDPSCQLRTATDQIFQTMGIRPTITVETAQDLVIYGFVAVIPYPLGGIPYHTKALTIANSIPPRKLYLIWNKNRYFSPAMHYFRDYVMDKDRVFSQFTIKSSLRQLNHRVPRKAQRQEVMKFQGVACY